MYFIETSGDIIVLKICRPSGEELQPYRGSRPNNAAIKKCYVSVVSLAVRAPGANSKDRG